MASHTPTSKDLFCISFDLMLDYLADFGLFSKIYKLVISYQE